MVDADLPFVHLPDARRKAGCHALVEPRAGAVVVGTLEHGPEAQGRVVPSFWFQSSTPRTLSWLARLRSTLPALLRRGALLTRLTAPPVEPRPNSMEAEPRSTSMRSREEGVAVIEGRVAQAVGKHVARGLQRKAAQTDVFLTAFGGLKLMPAVWRSVS